MSNLEQLISEFCPNGVDHVHLWEVTIWDKRFNSVGRKKQKQIITYPYLLASNLFSLEQPTGDVFLLSTGEKTGWTNEELAGNHLCQGEVVAIPWGKSRPLKEVIKYYKGKFVTADNRIATSKDTDKLLNKYLYYCMINQGETIDKFYRGSGIKHPNMNAVLNVTIPLPPIPVQEEIVRILDKFTKLTAELTAELTARKQQYEYYRDELFAFSDNVLYKPLQEIADIGTGGSNTNEELEIGKYPFFVRSQEVRRKDSYEFDETAIITSGDGVGVGKIFHYVEGKYALHQRAYRIHINTDDVIPKYYYYYMKSAFLSYIEKNSFHSSVTSIRRPMLNNLPVPIPYPEDKEKSLAEQQRIVDILDRFDKLCNDISEGLPAEIEARQKQYEYYRDKLLTFKKKEAAENE